MNTNEVNTNEVKATFEQYLAANMTKGDYDQLQTKLKVTPNKFTRMLKNPNEIDFYSLLTIVHYLQNDIKALRLVDSFDVGIDAITVREYRKLKQ